MLTKDFEVTQDITEERFSKYNGVTFLSPFDNLVWNKRRMKEFYNYSLKLEAYLPKEKRKFGYYNMSILYGDQVIGTFDPKMHRHEGVLEIKMLHFENNFRPDNEFKEKVTQAFRSFMKFNKVKEITIGKITPNMMKALILQHIGEALP